MSGTAQREAPHVGIFWLVQTPEAEPRLLATGCPLDQAEPYGDCLTYGPGHCETWAQWPRDRTVDPALRALVRSHEYEDWPRGRIVFDRSRDLFILYADRELLAPAMSARIATQFHLLTSEHRDAERARVMMRATRIVDRAHETGDVEPRGDQYWPTASFRGEADAARAAGVAGQYRRYRRAP
jgi:hypothetical protein